MKKKRMQKGQLFAVTAVLLSLMACGPDKKDPKYIDPASQQPQTQVQEQTQETEQTVEAWSCQTVQASAANALPESVVSDYGILINVEEGEILAAKKAGDRINPASMTKILTVLVAAEHIKPEQLEETVTVSKEATDYSYSNGCSNTGYEVDEQVTVQDLFYGTILPSGADSAYTLAVYVAGSHEAFVDMMNEKLKEMGLSDTTHFTNCVGLYDEDHYSTVYDMAVILKNASDNEFCRKVLSARKYVTTQTKEHEEGLTVSNWFLRRIEDKDTHGEVLCAKTGFVNQSGSCAASLAADKDGHEYLCVTAGSTSSWRCIYDHVDIYDAFLPEEEPVNADAGTETD